MKRTAFAIFAIVLAFSAVAQDPIQAGERFEQGSFQGLVVASGDTSFKYNAESSNSGFAIIDQAGEILTVFQPLENTDIVVDFSTQTVDYKTSDGARRLNIAGQSFIGIVRGD